MARLTCALGPDSAGTLLRQLIRGAREQLDVAVYEVGPRYGWMFPEAARRGARVRVLLDRHGGANRGCLDELAEAQRHDGVVVPCRMVRHRLGGEAHWKLLCADADRLAVGTGNLIERDAPYGGSGQTPPAAPALVGTREWWAFVGEVPSLVGTARRRISVAWRQATPPPALWTVEEEVQAPPVGAPLPAVAPLDLELAARRLRLATDAHAVREMLREELSAPRQRVLVVVPYVHTWALAVRPLLDRLGALASEGLDVRILLGSPPSGGDATTLRDRGIPARVMDPLRCTTGHAKGMVADGAVIISSANWSEAGLSSSLEAALRIDHPAAAAYYAEAFDRDWETAARADA